MSLTSPSWQAKDPWHASELTVHKKLTVAGQNVGLLINKLAEQEIPEWETGLIPCESSVLEVVYQKEFSDVPHVSVQCVGRELYKWYLLELRKDGFKIEFSGEYPTQVSYAALL